jgi:hypothetical protein
MRTATFVVVTVFLIFFNCWVIVVRCCNILDGYLCIFL